MANKQTKAYRKLGLSTKNTGAALTSINSFEIFKGRPCLTDFKDKEKNPQNKRKSAHRYGGRRGHADTASE
jgi:hypothetical protein